MHSSLRPGRMCSLRPPLPWVLLPLLAAIGCATPGLPKPPTLNLPEPVRDLAVARIGNTIELRFTLPTQSTDQLPLRGLSIDATFCRELDHQTCVPIPSAKITFPLDASANRHNLSTLTETLPPALTHGPAHTLGYRVSLSNAAGRSAGNSPPAFTASGEAPAAVTALRAEGSRLGIILRWDFAPSTRSDITLQREDLAPTHPAAHRNSIPAIVQLAAPSNPATPSSLLDTTALPNIPYRYTATRSQIIQLGGRAIELRSTPSAPVEITLHTTYPPAAPVGLTAAAFFIPAPGNPAFAVDLIWQPAEETGLITPLSGYILYRERLGPDLQPLAAPSRLNPQPLTLPAFHDTTADPAARYRYRVTAIDAHGNESPAAVLLLDPTPQP